jgi:predicted component of type VI protein secretion system
LTWKVDNFQYTLQVKQEVAEFAFMNSLFRLKKNVFQNYATLGNCILHENLSQQIGAIAKVYP